MASKIPFIYILTETVAANISEVLTVWQALGTFMQV